MKQLYKATLESLEQTQALIKACNDQQYVQIFEHASAGVGKHVRHILDHFSAVKEGLSSGVINYNMRARDSAVETDPLLALGIIEEHLLWLSNAPNDDLAIKVESEISLTQTSNVVLDSTLSRELCYLINHTIHHIAYATLGAKQLGITFEKELGLAPSTATYLRTQASTTR